MLGIIIGIIAVLLVVGFSVWFILRTPTNLRKWYGIPVVLVLLALVVLIIIALFL